MSELAKELIGRTKGLYNDLDKVTVGKHLRCTVCDRTEPSRPPSGHASYFATGWPKCCGLTMTLEDAPSVSEPSGQEDS